MTFTTPLSCDNYINAGNYFQKQLSNHSNLAMRTALVFAKIIGRGQDVLIHASLGSIKLIASTAMAIYSIPAAAFDLVPTHHKVAKQASRHFGLALFFIADMPLSLAHILKMYPVPLCRKIQKKLSISSYYLKFDQIIDGLRDTANSCTEVQVKQREAIYQENQILKEENEILLKISQFQEEQIVQLKCNRQDLNWHLVVNSKEKQLLQLRHDALVAKAEAKW